MGLVRLPCFFNCVQRIEKYSTTSSKMIKNGIGGHFFISHNSKPWKQAPDLPIEPGEGRSITCSDLPLTVPGSCAALL
jgi:hypothetical protein